MNGPVKATRPKIFPKPTLLTSRICFTFHPSRANRIMAPLKYSLAVRINPTAKLISFPENRTLLIIGPSIAISTNIISSSSSLYTIEIIRVGCIKPPTNNMTSWITIGISKKVPSREFSCISSSNSIITITVSILIGCLFITGSSHSPLTIGHTTNIIHMHLPVKIPMAGFLNHNSSNNKFNNYNSNGCMILCQQLVKYPMI